MMGEVVSVLEGKIRVGTLQIYTCPDKQHLTKHNMLVILESHPSRLWRSAAVSAPHGETDHSPL